MNETITFTEIEGTRHSKLTFLSNAFGLLCSTLIGAVQGFTLFYYEAVVGLDALFIAIAMTIFLVYNAINDPIFGFLIDRNLRFTRKWGRRFPWIVVAIGPWVLSIFLLFSVPNTIDGTTNPGAAFGWLLLSLVLLDTFGTLVNINYKAIQIEKFRTEYERNRFTKYYAPLDILAIVLGMLLPPLFTDMIPGDPRGSYSTMAAILAIIALIFGILSLPGNREDKIMIDRHFSPESVKRMNFFKVFKEAVKTKSYAVWFLFGICNGIWISLVVANMLYVTTFVLQVGGDMFPTNAFVWDSDSNDWGEELDWLKPVDPNLSISDFDGLSVAEAIELYDGSAGGTGFDLKDLDPNDYAALVIDPNTGRKWIQYIKVDYLPGSDYAGEIDGFSDVAGCGDYQHPYPQGDINADCRVNMMDMAVLAENWMDCTWNCQ